MLRKTAFVLVCLLSGAIAIGSQGLARANPEARRSRNEVPHDFTLIASSLTESASHFSERKRLVASPKQPPKAIELAIGDQNFSQVILTNRDLPGSFQAMPPADLEQLRQDLNEDDFDFKVESLFAFANQNNIEVVMGITTTIRTEQERAEFDKVLNQPEELQALLTQGLGLTQVLDKEPLQALSNIGDAVGGTRMKVNLEGIPALLDIVAFRRDVIGAFVFVMYLDGATPARSIADLARQLDERAVGVLSGSN